MARTICRPTAAGETLRLGAEATGEISWLELRNGFPALVDEFVAEADSEDIGS